MTDPELFDPARRKRARERRAIREVLKYVAMFFVWNLGASVALGLGYLLHAELAGLALILLLAFWMVRGYLLGGRGGARRRSLIRPRPLRGPVLKWTLLCVPVVLLAAWSLGEVWVRLVHVPPESLSPFESLTRTVMGKITLSIIAVAVAPVMEEFFFRGLIQGTAERAWRPASAILFAAAVFAVAHFLPWVFPLHLFLGAAFGYAVHVTRSIWPGVILHAANNAVAVVGLVQTEEPEPTPTIWTTGLTADWWVAVAGLLFSALLLFFAARALRAAGRLRPLAPRG